SKRRTLNKKTELLTMPTSLFVHCCRVPLIPLGHLSSHLQEGGLEGTPGAYECSQSELLNVISITGIGFYLGASARKCGRLPEVGVLNFLVLYPVVEENPDFRRMDR